MSEKEFDATDGTMNVFFSLMSCMFSFGIEHFHFPVQPCGSYLDAASHKAGDVLLTAALQPVKDEGSILFHLDGEETDSWMLKDPSRAKSTLTM